MKTKTKLNVQTMTAIGMFAALIAVLSQLAIPMPSGVPVTLQTFAIALCGFFLGWRAGLASVTIYILIGAVGVPVFANFTGGLAKLSGLTGGFIWGFLPMVVLCGLFASGKTKKIFTARRFLSILTGIAGLALCHVAGVFQFAYLSSSTFAEAALLVSVPYLLKDIISVAVAAFAAGFIKRCLPASVTL